MAMPLSALQPYLQRVGRIRPRTALAATAAVAGLIPALSYAVHSYRGFLAVGRGGMPYNVFGWLLQAVAKLIARSDFTATHHYSRPEVISQNGPFAGRSFLPRGADSLPKRAGARPVVAPYVAPQRQSTQSADPDMTERMKQFLETAARGGAGELEIRPSKLEGLTGPAVYLCGVGEAATGFVRMVGEEIVHVHGEGSSHVTLSVADAEEVLRKGWGQRHALSGPWLHWTYVLIYAPHNQEEWEVWKEIVLAGCSFMLSSLKGEVREVPYGSEETPHP